MVTVEMGARERAGGEGSASPWPRATNTYWLARTALYRGIGVVYTFGFLVHLMQGKGMSRRRTVI